MDSSLVLQLTYKSYLFNIIRHGLRAASAKKKKQRREFMRKLLSLVLMIVLMSSITCDAGKKGTSVEGKVVDGQGKPLAGIRVVATQKEPLKGYEKFETKTKADGTFVLKGLYPESDYVIVPEAGHFNKKAATVEMKSGPAGEVKMINGNIVCKFSPFKISNDGVITDSRTGLEWAPDPGREMNWDQANQYAQSLTLAGGGWRLPTRAELRGLYDESYEGDCNIDPLFSLTGCCPWSSQLDGPSDAWGFGFGNGSELSYSRDASSYDTRALAVRSRR